MPQRSRACVARQHCIARTRVCCLVSLRLFPAVVFVSHVVCFSLCCLFSLLFCFTIVRSFVFSFFSLIVLFFTKPTLIAVFMLLFSLAGSSLLFFEPLFLLSGSLFRILFYLVFVVVFFLLVCLLFPFVCFCLCSVFNSDVFTFLSLLYQHRCTYTYFHT